MLVELRRRSNRFSFATAVVGAFGVHAAVILGSLLLPSRAAARSAPREDVFFTVSVESPPAALPDAPAAEGEPAAAREPLDPITTTKIATTTKVATRAPQAPTATAPASTAPASTAPASTAPAVGPEPVDNTGVVARSDRQEQGAPGALNGIAFGSGHASVGESSTGSGSDGLGLGTAGRPVDSVLPFGPGMTRPSLLSKTDPTYTREALEARVEGLMLVKCTITLQGALERCRIVKSLAHMDGAVLAALSKWRYAPVTYQGRAVAVDYVIPVRLVLQ